MALKDRTSSSDDIIRERIRQARWSFNLALFMMTASTVIGLVGISLLLSGRVSQGTVQTAGGAASSACCYKFMKDANDRLDKLSVD